MYKTIMFFACIRCDEQGTKEETGFETVFGRFEHWVTNKGF